MIVNLFFFNELTVVSVTMDIQGSAVSLTVTIAVGISVQNMASVWTSSTTTPVGASQGTKECSARSRQMNASVPHVLMVPPAWIFLPVTAVSVLQDLKVSYTD